MNMMKKTVKVKPEQRTALVEFLVMKRVKYLEYLKDIHSDEGGLWMNTIYLNRPYLGKYFGVPADCLLPPDVGAAGGGAATGANEMAGMVRLPVDTTYGTRDTGAAAAAISPATGEAEADEEAFTYVSLDKLPNPASVGRDSSIGEWHKRYLPGYMSFGIALSDLLLVSVSGEEFLECFYHLLLEVDVALSGGLAAKTLAQRNLRTLRQHMSPALTAALNAGAVGENATAASEEGSGAAAALASAESPTPGLSNASAAAAAVASNFSSPDQFKYVFLQSQHLAYTAAPPSYDTVMPALFSVLIFAYRRLCDYELLHREDCVKRILSIDKHIEKAVLARLGKELEKAAKLKLVREAYILSPRGLFMDVAGGEANADFINDIIATAQRSESEKKASAAAGDAAGTEALEDASSSDSDDVVDA